MKQLKKHEREWIYNYKTDPKNARFEVKLNITNEVKEVHLIINEKKIKLNRKKFSKFMKSGIFYYQGPVIWHSNYKICNMCLLESVLNNQDELL